MTRDHPSLPIGFPKGVTESDNDFKQDVKGLERSRLQSIQSEKSLMISGHLKGR